MKTTYIGQDKLIIHNGIYYAFNETTEHAVMQIEWANRILDAPAVTWPSGKDSHETAGAILDEFEDALIDHIRIVVGG